MLILTRRPDEQIVIGSDITVTILEVRGNQVRIGIDAPKELSVHRLEIANRIKRLENMAKELLTAEVTV